MKYEKNKLINKKNILNNTNNYYVINVEQEKQGILFNNNMFTNNQNSIIKKLYDSLYFQIFNNLLWNPYKEYHINDECLCLFYLNNGFILKSVRCIKSDENKDYTNQKPFNNNYISNDTNGTLYFQNNPDLNNTYWMYNTASSLNIQQQTYTFKENKDLIIQLIDYKDKYYEDINISLNIQRGNYSLYAELVYNARNNILDLNVINSALNAPDYNINNQELENISQLGMFFILDETECKLYLHTVYDNNQVLESLDNTNIIISSISNSIIDYKEIENITYSANNKLLPIVKGCNNKLSTTGEIKIYNNKLTNKEAAERGLLLIDSNYTFNKDNIIYPLHNKVLIDHDKKYLISTNDINKDNVEQKEIYKNLDIKRKTSFKHIMTVFDGNHNYKGWGGIFYTNGTHWLRDNKDYNREWNASRRTISYTNYYFKLYKKPRDINNFYINDKDANLYEDSLNCYYYIKLY